MNKDVIKDSGHRRVFETGAQRDRSTDKPRPGLISPIFLWRLGNHLGKGALKYNYRNWEIGIPLSEYIESAFRHLIAIMESKTDEDHESACAFNIMAFMHTKEMTERGLLPKKLNDMPEYNND